VRAEAGPAGAGAARAGAARAGAESGELAEALARAGVTAGVEVAVLAWLTRELADPNFEVTDAVIARGVTPQPGEDGRFELLFAVGIQPGHLRDDGTFDFHALSVG